MTAAALVGVDREVGGGAGPAFAGGFALAVALAVAVVAVARLLARRRSSPRGAAAMRRASRG
ncbi:conserved hypothetical protein [Anaeromyxobacter dehalogenans 2CP-1]|uniref:Uncharacterized protein n=1 Tax=Anaeromyxobacter dehalogenans (strain ATCC BAA-258 / DSM 21875 / 2CP-1) TaxID=455488 RepID=B8JEA1_ANAD2|nr:hypothetical protein [Anaeromyxobacter dehalogenans]ACL66166.1 conserved hypothetical protein [Anaeromyxobacter dehalogenans 2CP-1]